MESLSFFFLVAFFVLWLKSEARYWQHQRRRFEDDFQCFMEERGGEYRRYLKEDPLAKRRVYQWWRRHTG